MGARWGGILIAAFTFPCSRARDYRDPGLREPSPFVATIHQFLCPLVAKQICSAFDYEDRGAFFRAATVLLHNRAAVRAVPVHKLTPDSPAGNL